MATKRDYYEILGVSRDATQEEIKRAYRALAKKYHPDVCKDPNANERFAEIQVAYDCLSDETKRQNYDRYGTEEPGNFNGSSGGYGGEGFGGFGFDDIFSSIFGGGRSSSRGSSLRGRDIQTSVTITFEEACFGVKKNINVTRFEECENCKGKGAEKEEDIIKCPKCAGRGRVLMEQNSIFGTIRTEAECPGCRGTGKKIKNPCPKCNGLGRSRRNATILVNIPAGIDDDQVIRKSGEGEAGIQGGAAGDLLVRVNVKEHEIFVRDGNDIYLELPITFSQAALGATIQIKTIHGLVNMKIPAGTQTGTKCKLAGKGIESKVNGRTGHQIVTIKIVTPTNLTSTQRNLFEQLSKTDESRGNSFFDKVWKFFKK